ncbi:MAG: TetR/AcrR family transcriptional regulator [Spirochaetes bacterium]|nr:MAG: TetR/AcrR family transcriptional regulator [Spirochaetota bacterium]
MNYDEFKTEVLSSAEDVYRQYYRAHRQRIKIKKEDLAVKNYMMLTNTALKLSAEKGFQAMTMRDLAREAGMSMGALYYYFSGKNEILERIHDQGHKFVLEILLKYISLASGPAEKLRTAIRTHLYLSELMRLWFYFFFMETKHLGKKHRQTPMESELWTEGLYVDLLEEGRRAGVYAFDDPDLIGASIKSLLQDWYLKRWKYVQRGVTVEKYTDFVISLIEAYVTA